ncbi:hypothetical protein [Hamadaea tsunoensis]|uniref:hypothetical protein n=1 Tax=Hamadaea tsunoensis TaxID=53368 RepID=UPI0003F78901|nr:hypothetical protein [Hamadaea tsunoensis]
MDGDDDPRIGYGYNRAGWLTVRWPRKIDKLLVKPDVDIIDGQPDARMLTVCCAPYVFGLYPRPVKLPVPFRFAGQFRFLSWFQFGLQGRFLFRLTLLPFAIAGLITGLQRNWLGFAIVALLGAYVLMCRLVGVTRPARLPQYPVAAPEGMVQIEGVHAAFVNALIAANPDYAPSAGPRDDAFASKYAAAG